MKIKKLVSLIMAGAMTLALAVPAFAASTATLEYKDDHAVEVEATVKDFTISVTVPGSSDLSLTLNPYKQDVSGKSDQVIFAEQTITSATAVPLSVSAKIKAEVGQDVKLATSSVAAVDAKKPVADKQLFLFLAFSDESFGTDAPTYDAKSTSQMVFSTKEATKDGIASLAKGDSTPANVYYIVSGDCASQPLSAWDKDADTVKLSIALAFVATAIAEE